MTREDAPDSAAAEDVAWRSALRDLDPAADDAADDDSLLARAWERVSEETANQPPTTRSDSTGRHPPWRSALVGMLAAACLLVAVGAGLAVVGYFATATDDSTAMAPAEPVIGAAEPGIASDMTETDSAGGPTPTTASDASAVVATPEVAAARDSFVRTITELGGTVTSETVTSDTSTDASASSSTVSSGSYPGDTAMIYPPILSVPGIALSVEVPATAFDQALASARELGEVVTFSRSSVDLGTSITDTDARIVALEASLARLNGLMDQATSLSDIIALESAIATRQAELDGLTAMARQLASQVEQSRITLQLVTPDTADEYFRPTQPSAWQGFLDTARTVWLAAGAFLLVTSPLWIIGAAIWWWRRRH